MRTERYAMKQEGVVHWSSREWVQVIKQWQGAARKILSTEREGPKAFRQFCSHTYTHTQALLSGRAAVKRAAVVMHVHMNECKKHTHTHQKSSASN